MKISKKICGGLMAFFLVTSAPALAAKKKSKQVGDQKKSAQVEKKQVKETVKKRVKAAAKSNPKKKGKPAEPAYCDLLINSPQWGIGSSLTQSQCTYDNSNPWVIKDGCEVLTELQSTSLASYLGTTIATIRIKFISDTSDMNWLSTSCVYESSTGMWIQQQEREE